MGIVPYNAFFPKMKLYMVSSCIVFGFVLYTFAPRFHTKIVWDTLDGEGYQFKEASIYEIST